MNERIRQLADEAKKYAAKKYALDAMIKITDKEQALKVYSESYDTKFAELIVRECANHCDLLLDHKISSEWSRGTHDCSRAIKKHFGVEE
jgi:hypothetical protein